MVHSLFDPLGFVALVLLEPKLLLKKLNDRKWDETITDEEKGKWKEWLASLEQLEEIAIPRYLKSQSSKGEIR